MTIVCVVQRQTGTDPVSVQRIKYASARLVSVTQDPSVAADTHFKPGHVSLFSRLLSPPLFPSTKRQGLSLETCLDTVLVRYNTFITNDINVRLNKRGFY